MVHEEEHPPQGPTPSRKNEHHNRQRILDHERQVRLDVMPNSVQSDQPEARAFGNRPIC